MPQQLSQLLWDVDKNSFDYKSYPDFVAYRIAEYGDFSLVQWFCQEFGFDQFYDAIISHKQVKAHTKSFWLEYKRLNGTPTFRSTNPRRA